MRERERRKAVNETTRKEGFAAGRKSENNKIKSSGKILLKHDITQIRDYKIHSTV